VLWGRRWDEGRGEVRRREGASGGMSEREV